jgi:transposase
MKTMDLHVRPINHHLENRVRAHIFLCMLAYYVEWHMREAWRSVTFADEDQEAKKTRDPVAPAKRSEKALEKVHAHQLDDGTPTHSFQTLLKDLSGIVKTIFRRKSDAGPAVTLAMTTTLSPERKRALDLIEGIAL